LFDEDRPVSSSYPYGISKLQGERAVLQMCDDDFSVIALRKGTVSGYSPRMRFDLLVNTMFKTAMKEGVIRVSNPSIWRPFLSIEDAAMAYTRSIEATERLSGVFNIASGNATLGEIADQVKATLEGDLGIKLEMEINRVNDVRNYKVAIDRAKNILSFHPQHDVKSIVRNLIANMSKCKDWDNPAYYNIRVFKEHEVAETAELAANQAGRSY
jgi:nucleoside-diphosphate-sugar epimerase